MSCEGLLIVISAPSGTGKGTIMDVLKERYSNIRYSVSATTRNPREGEIDGQNYFFKTVEEFKRMIADNELVEWVEYCNNYYGTPRKYIMDNMKQGLDTILEIEVEGAVNIIKQFPECVTIFILPPSFSELKRRIEKRGTEHPEIITKRLGKAKIEVAYVDKYDYVVINDDVEKAVNEINCIITAEKLKYNRNKEILDKIGI